MPRRRRRDPPVDRGHYASYGCCPLRIRNHFNVDPREYFHTSEVYALVRALEDGDISAAILVPCTLEIDKGDVSRWRINVGKIR